MSYLLLVVRVRRKLDYVLDTLEFIESLVLREEINKCIIILKEDLLKFNNLLTKKDIPLVEQKLESEWQQIFVRFKKQWQQLKDGHPAIFTTLTESQYDWIISIENEINTDLTSSADLTLNELREIAKHRLLEYELIEFGQNIQSIFKAANTSTPTCFISYAWGNKTHEDQVHAIAYLLKYAGIEVLLDIWCNKVDSIPAFTTLITKQKSDYVLVIGTQLLRQKYETRTLGKGSWVGEELDLIYVRKRDYPNNHGIIKLLLEAPASQSFPDFLSPLAHDYTDFDLKQNYYLKFFHLLELLYEKYPAIKDKLENLHQIFLKNEKILNQVTQEELIVLLQLNNLNDYEKQQAEKESVFLKLKQASRLLSQFVEREFGNELLYAEILKTRLQVKYAENDQIKRLFYPQSSLPVAICYLHLALIQDKELKGQQDKANQIDTFLQRNHLLHEYERIDHIQQKLEVHEIIRECKSPIKRVFIEGAAGSGKSTLCQRIAYDWSQSKEPWQHYKWLFHIRLRDLKNTDAYTKDYLGKILQECFRQGDGELDEWQLERVRKEMHANSRQVMFLLDGYDELQLDAETLKKLLEPLKDYDFIVTSRPGSNFKTDLLNHHIKLEQLLHLAVLGFSDQQIKQYINHFFDPQYTPKVNFNDAISCFTRLRNNSNLWSLAHIPIQLELLCSMWGDELKDNNTLTFTQLYEFMVDKLLKRLEIDRKGECHSDLFVSELKEIYAKQLEYLEYIAFLGMQANKLVLERELYIERSWKDLKSKLQIADAKKFLKEIKMLGLFKFSDNGKQGEFIHLTFQEFFAAKYWVKLYMQSETRHQATQLLIAQKDNVRFQIMWWFVAGLLKHELKPLETFFLLLLEKEELAPLQKLLLSNPQRLLLALRCSEESIQNFNTTISYHQNLLLIYKQYVERILLPPVRQKGYFISNNAISYKQLISTLKLSPKIISNLDINELFERELLTAKKHQTIEFEIAHLILNLGYNNFPIITKIAKLLFKHMLSCTFLPSGNEMSLINNIGIRQDVAKLLIKFNIKKEIALNILKLDLYKNHNLARYLAAIHLIELDEYKEDALKALLISLKVENAADRYNAARSLLRFDEYKKDAIKALAINLKTEKAKDRYNAASLLLQLNEYKESAIKALINNLDAPDVSDRCNAAALLLKFSEQKTEAEKVLVNALKSADYRDRIRTAILLIKLSLMEKEALDVITEDLKNGLINQKLFAAKQITQLDKYKTLAVDALKSMLSKRDTHFRHSAAKLLIELNEQRIEVIKMLQKDLNLEEIKCRYFSVKHLIEMGEEQENVLKILRIDLGSPILSIRYSAATWLIKLSYSYKPEVIKMLATDLKATDIEVRSKAIEKMIKIGEMQKVTDLLRHDLLAEEARIRYLAAQWLIRLDTHIAEVITALELDLNTEDSSVHSIAKKLLAKINNKSGETVSKFFEEMAIIFFKQQAKLNQDKSITNIDEDEKFYSAKSDSDSDEQKVTGFSDDDCSEFQSAESDDEQMSNKF